MARRRLLRGRRPRRLDPAGVGEPDARRAHGPFRRPARRARRRPPANLLVRRPADRGGTPPQRGRQGRHRRVPDLDAADGRRLHPRDLRADGAGLRRRPPARRRAHRPRRRRGRRGGRGRGRRRGRRLGRTPAPFARTAGDPSPGLRPAPRIGRQAARRRPRGLRARDRPRPGRLLRRGVRRARLARDAGDGARRAADVRLLDGVHPHRRVADAQGRLAGRGVRLPDGRPRDERGVRDDGRRAHRAQGHRGLRRDDRRGCF